MYIINNMMWLLLRMTNQRSIFTPTPLQDSTLSEKQQQQKRILPSILRIELKLRLPREEKWNIEEFLLPELSA